MQRFVITREYRGNGSNGPFHLPFVELDKEKGIFRIYGYSLEEDEYAEKCYNDIFWWLERYLKEPNLDKPKPKKIARAFAVQVSRQNL